MEPPVSLECWDIPRADKISCEDGASAVTTTSSSHDHVAPQQPAKMQKRQWDAWTHQEEESFFTALGQVGKNFKKITYKVQSKNSDQVRHYYYRLLRRMNKLLGPELCLNAKNSKETNSAMLQWWTLLEKHNFKASKLHLKPRRLKIYLDVLKHQLLMERIKNIRKRHALGKVCSTTATETAFSQGKALANDSHTVKVVLLNSQYIQKLGSGKGSLLKHNANIGVNRSNCNGDSIPLEAVRQQQKPGDTSPTAAYKRLEKAAIAGVLLVADAAEHLERTALDKSNEPGKGETCGDPIGNVVPSSATSLQNLCVDSGAQTLLKLKLQLFPIDEMTRRALEMDDHNPHVELTLSTRKKVSSVLEHLNRKWGKSSIACGELLLLPYCAQKENLINCQRWTQDSVLSVADVYKQIGSPSIFRLRYCWLSTDGHEMSARQAPVPLPGIFSEYITKINNTDHQNVDKVTDFTPEHVPYIWPLWR